MNLTITLKGDVPSKKNSKQMVCRGRRPILLPSKGFREWHDIALYSLPKRATPVYPTLITITFFPRTWRRADATNKAESIMDLLVDAGILEDDNWFIVSRLSLELGEVDKDNPRAVINIEYERTRKPVHE